MGVDNLGEISCGGAGVQKKSKRLSCRVPRVLQQAFLLSCVCLGSSTLPPGIPGHHTMGFTAIAGLIAFGGKHIKHEGIVVVQHGTAQQPQGWGPFISRNWVPGQLESKGFARPPLLRVPADLMGTQLSIRIMQRILLKRKISIHTVCGTRGGACSET